VKKRIPICIPHMCRGGVAAPARYETSCRTRRAAQRRPCFCPPYNYAFLHSPCAGCFQTQLFSPAGKILIYRGVGTYRPHPSRLRRATFPKGEGFWMRFTWPTCRGCRGRQRRCRASDLRSEPSAVRPKAEPTSLKGLSPPDFQSYAAACTPRAGPFSRQGACDRQRPRSGLSLQAQPEGRRRRRNPRPSAATDAGR